MTSHYSNLDAARDAGLVARGWLPDRLPASTRRLVVNNNLDLNTSSGSFDFAPAEAREFGRLWVEGVPERESDAYRRGFIEDYEAMGFKAWSYAEDGEQWVFFCHARLGRCDYDTWMLR